MIQDQFDCRRKDPNVTLMASTVTWAAGLSAVGGIATPIVVVIAGIIINRRVRSLEDKRWHNQELIRTRLGYYDDLAGSLNDLLCYFTFVGTWKELSPEQVIKIKRDLDKKFYVAVPLFSTEARVSYKGFIDRCFQDYGAWGQDALLLTGFEQREAAYRETWDSSWDDLFAYPRGREVPPGEIKDILTAYNGVLASLVKDIDLVAPRAEYSDSRAVANAR